MLKVFNMSEKLTRKLYQEGHKLDASLYYITRHNFKQDKQKQYYNDKQNIVDSPKLGKRGNLNQHVSSEHASLVS